MVESAKNVENQMKEKEGGKSKKNKKKNNEVKETN